MIDFTTGTTATIPKAKFEINGRKYLVKGNRKGEFQAYAEVVASRLAARVYRFPCVTYGLVHRSKFHTVESYEYPWLSICRLWEFQTKQLYRYLRRVHKLTNNVTNREVFELTLKTFPSDAQHIIDALYFDALIGNTDRHWNNFDVNLAEKRIAPLLDFGESLCCNTWSESDKSRPLLKTHREQVGWLRSNGYLSTLKPLSTGIVKWYSDSCADIASTIPGYLDKQIKEYLEQRYENILGLIK